MKVSTTFYSSYTYHYFLMVPTLRGLLSVHLGEVASIIVNLCTTVSIFGILIILRIYFSYLTIFLAISKVRSSKLAKHSKYAPADGNRYDGTYKVRKCSYINYVF